jgi:hypothetical protein
LPPLTAVPGSREDRFGARLIDVDDVDLRLLVDGVIEPADSEDRVEDASTCTH